MDGSQDWADEYQRLLDQLKFARYRSAPKPVKERHSEYGDIVVGYEQTNEHRETERPPTEIENDIHELLEQIVTVEVDQSCTYEYQIRRLLEIVENDLDASLLVDVVGCSKSCAYRFTYDEDTKKAVEKEWSKNYQQEKVSTGTRSRIFRQDDNMCVRCGAEESLQIHHITPVSEGGTKENENLVTLCKSCHKAAHGGSWTEASVVYDSEPQFDNWIEDST